MGNEQAVREGGVPRRHRGLRLVPVVALVAVLAVGLGIRGHAVAPDRAVERYLDALEQQDVGALKAILDLEGHGLPFLLDSPDAAPTEDLVSGTELTGRERQGEDWQISARAVQSGISAEGTFTVTERQDQGGEAPRWLLPEVSLGTLSVHAPEEVSEVRINGVVFAAEDVSYNLLALPGRYTIELVTPEEHLYSAPESVVVQASMGDHSQSEANLALRLEFSPSAVAEVQEEMETMVDQYAEVDPDGLSRCPMRVPDPDAEWGSGRWEFDQLPEAELTYLGELRGTAATAGSEVGGGPTATVTYHTSRRSPTPGVERTLEVEYSVGGFLEIDDDGELVTELYMNARRA